ncbi:MAG: substrate-binding domain-containing protein [Microbacteriaceae bacterium]
MKATKKYLAIAGIAGIAALTLSACAGGGDNPTPTTETTPAYTSEVDIGVVYSETGALAGYGAQFRDAFEIGLDYITDGTMIVNNTKINVSFHDDGGDADKATQAAKELIADGVQIITGTAASGIALALADLAKTEQILYVSGPAAADAITGINEYTFRSGRQSLQDTATAGGFLDKIDGSKVVVFAQDTAFGQGNVAAVQAVLGAKGATIVPLLVPEAATEFSPFVAKLLAEKPDLVFVAWAGATSGAMWQSMEQQNVFDVAPIVTGLGDIPTYQAFGANSGNISFLNHYFAGANTHKLNQVLIDGLKAKGKEADLFSPDGFNAAIMLVHAIAEGGDSVPAYIKALEGWTFDGPKGKMTVRAEDHALLQEMYQVRLVEKGGVWVPELIATVSPEDAAPPVKK